MEDDRSGDGLTSYCRAALAFIWEGDNHGPGQSSQPDLLVLMMWCLGMCCLLPKSVAGEKRGNEGKGQ